MVKRPRKHAKQRLALLAMMPDRCRAHARSTGKPCVAKAMANGRCKNHGGMCTGAKTPEGRARISAAQTRRWEAWREKMGRTKPTPAPAPGISELETDILQRLMEKLLPAKTEDPTEKCLREELVSSTTPRVAQLSQPVVEPKPPAPLDRPAPAVEPKPEFEFLSIKSELRRYQVSPYISKVSPYISKPPLPTRATVSPAAARRMRGRG